jgi:two-component system cell cycle sensor histidine kinase/response regulator CckA
VDLTDIRHAQEEAHERHNLESLGVLAGGIAHDFNNLLGGALAFSELAQAKLVEGTAPLEELRKIGEVAARGSEIVRQLMIYAGNETGTLGPVDISSVVTDMLALLKISVSKHAALKTTLAPDLPGVRANSAQIRQVVMNLVTNASEAIGDQDGMIHVITGRLPAVSDSSQPEAAKSLAEGDYVRLAVSDTGSGMTPETQRRAFDPFYSTKFVGRGMGLAMVQRIVRGLGGTINVVTSPGNGCTIEVVLPGVAQTAPAFDRYLAIRAPRANVQTLLGTRILVVEDEPTLLLAVSRLLQSRGLSVIQASDGSAALDLIRARQDRLDAMLLDVTLPGASAFQVLQEAQRLRPDLAVILTSAYSHETIQGNFNGFRVEHFLRKPFHADDFVSMLQGLLARSRVGPESPKTDTRSV